MKLRGRFGVDDVAQQVVGGVLLAGPFVVTEEVWTLAASMSTVQWALTVAMVVSIGYGSLYRADRHRDPDEEGELAGIPTRFLSLMVVAYGSVGLLAFALDAPDAFGASLRTTLVAISIGAVFSVVGAATADSLF